MNAIVISGARMRRSVIPATCSTFAAGIRRYSAVAIAENRIAVPVAESQFKVNRAASARLARYAGSSVSAGSTGSGSTGCSRNMVRCSPGTSNAGDSTACGAGGRPVSRYVRAPAGPPFRNALNGPAPQQHDGKRRSERAEPRTSQRVVDLNPRHHSSIRALRD